MAPCFIRYLTLLNVWWVPFQVSWGTLVIVDTDTERNRLSILEFNKKHWLILLSLFAQHSTELARERRPDFFNRRCREQVETIRQGQAIIQAGNPPASANRREVSFKIKQEIHNNISRFNETLSYASSSPSLQMLTCWCHHFTICMHVGIYTKQNWGWWECQDSHEYDEMMFIPQLMSTDSSCWSFPNPSRHRAQAELKKMIQCLKQMPIIFKTCGPPTKSRLWSVLGKISRVFITYHLA